MDEFIPIGDILNDSSFDSVSSDDDPIIQQDFENEDINSDDLLSDASSYNDLINSVDTLTVELQELRTEIFDNMTRSNELIGALLIVLLAHVTLMVFRKIFGMFN